MSYDKQQILEGPARRWSRRELLSRTTGAVAGLGAAAVLGACGASAAPTSTTASTGSGLRPRHGGTLSLAAAGGSTSDTLDAQTPNTFTDAARMAALYDNLLTYNNEVQLTPSLATEVIPNSDATSWTIRVRNDVTCHNGAPFGAKDVLYSFRRIANPKKPLPGASILTPLDLASARVLDPNTLRIPTTTPYSVFPDALTNFYCRMVPEDYNPNHPNGTGPFKFKTFTPGVSSVFTRFGNYWQEGRPYVDSLVITDYSDETAQVNALLSSQANMVDLLSAGSLGTVRSGGAKVVISPSGGYSPFTMRVDRPPFNDVRVRRAFRLLVDRPQMLDAIFGGYGTIGNDVFGPYDPSYDHSLPQRVQDIPQARSLLRAAGQEQLTVALSTSSGIGEGVVQAATVFVEQAATAGVKIALQTIPTVSYWAKYYLQAIFSQDTWNYEPYLLQVLQETLPGAPFNETHFDDANYDRLFKQAMATLDLQKRTELIHDMQATDYTSGGLIIPYFTPLFDAVAHNVQGVVPNNRTGWSLDNFNWSAFWLT
jgi:peptide/nickel transport system substrate-binding protein